MIDVDGLKNVFYGLFFAHVIDIVRDVVTSQTPNLRELIISIFGALYSFTILESGYRIREFQRSDDDFAALGRGYNLLGRFTDYLKMTDRIKNHTAASLAVQATAHLGVSQVERLVRCSPSFAFSWQGGNGCGRVCTAVATNADEFIAIGCGAVCDKQRPFPRNFGLCSGIGTLGGTTRQGPAAGNF